jgi:hypothetical protein
MAEVRKEHPAAVGNKIQNGSLPFSTISSFLIECAWFMQMQFGVFFPVRNKSDHLKYVAREMED